MKITFEYSKEKDIWCLLNKGKNSNNSSAPTKVYEQLVAICGNIPTEKDASNFIDEYLSKNNINIEERIIEYKKDWETIADQYQKRAESIFGVSIPSGVIAYLTINNRCPYDIEHNYFYVSLTNASARRTVMHELWHFYTWHGLGAEQEELLGKQKYNDVKEALTVLLNIDCKDLLPEGVLDDGYTQHQDMRNKITEFWKGNRDIKKLWNEFTK